MSLEHIHLDPASISAALYRPCPPGVPLEVWLDALSDDHGDPVLPPPTPSGCPDAAPEPAAPEEKPMSGWNDGSRAKCTKCGKVMRGSEPGECFRCRSGRARPDTTKVKGVRAAPRAPKKRRDADDELVNRLLDGADKVAQRAVDEALAEQKTADEKAAKHAAVERDESWLAKFYRLHEALGLNAEEAIEEHCRAWVESTTERALGGAAPPTLREFKKTKRARRAPKPNGAAPLDAIGDDYEKARAQAEGAPA